MKNNLHEASFLSVSARRLSMIRRADLIPAVKGGKIMGLNGVDSLEAAKEHYAFCTDRVNQGTRTYKISELAAGLAHSDVWYFWWD